MAVKVDPAFLKDLEHFGFKDAIKCYGCGTCTGVCPLSTDEYSFPRHMIRLAHLGLKDKIKASAAPWQCYYCGTCTERCPRGAEPGEFMMTMRRYLTSIYDWTGLSRKFYLSHSWEIAAIAVVGVLTGLGFLLLGGPMRADKVALNVFAPSWAVEIFDLILAVVLTFFLATNMLRCFWFTMGGWDLFRIPLKIYVVQFKEFILQFLTQRQFSKCDNRTPWYIHLLIMTGYFTMQILVIGLIRLFQRDEILPIYNPIRFMGYYATFAILYGTTYALIGRIRKSRPAYKHSHMSDYIFLVMLQLATLSGILVHIVQHWLELPLATYWMYIIHMTISVPMLVVEVPFSKWAHLAYRPLVLYLDKVKQAHAAQNQG